MSWVSRLGQTKNTDDASSKSDSENYTGFRTDKYDFLKEAVHKEVVSEYNTIFSESGFGDNASVDVMEMIRHSITRQEQVLTKLEESKIAQEIYDDVMGLGPLEVFLRDSSISEIMVNGPNQIYIERSGKLELVNSHFRDNAHVLNVLNRIVSSVGRRCDESNPMVDARLPDGSRVNAVIPPIALKGSTITIRKFSSTPLKIGDLIGYNSLSPQMAAFLEACIKGRCNTVVSGGTGSGKTTLLNVLSGYISDQERIVTIEDAAELQLGQNHVVTLEGRPSNIEGKGVVSIRDLVRNSLRMRPDRIIVGEVRSGETLDMLQAMNTGHDGSLTTVHANSPRDVVSRMETMVMMAGMELPAKAIREQIASAVDLVVHQSRFRDGSRKIVNISEIVGMEGDTITMQDVFVFKPNGVDGMGKVAGEFVSTGIRPKIAEKIRNNGGLCMDDWFFQKGR